MTHHLLTIAREAIRSGLDGRGEAASGAAGGSPPQGCFVSLKQRGRLRGCIGTLRPVEGSLEAEVAANAVAAATRDPRFPPLEPRELRELSISIDLLEPPEPVADETALDPAVYGVIVRNGKRVGVLLPGIPAVTSAARQVTICREKAGIGPEEPVTLERFRVRRLHEEKE